MNTKTQSILQNLQGSGDLPESVSDYFRSMLDNPDTVYLKVSGQSAEQIHTGQDQAWKIRPVNLPFERFYMEFSPSAHLSNLPGRPTTRQGFTELVGFIIYHPLHEMDRKLELARKTLAYCTIIRNLRISASNRRAPLISGFIVNLTDQSIYMRPETIEERAELYSTIQLKSGAAQSPMPFIKIPMKHEDGPNPEEPEDSREADIRDHIRLLLSLCEKMDSDYARFIPEPTTRQQRRLLSRQGKSNPWLLPRWTEE